jgi:hypothetical protein
MLFQPHACRQHIVSCTCSSNHHCPCSPHSGSLRKLEIYVENLDPDVAYIEYSTSLCLLIAQIVSLASPYATLAHCLSLMVRLLINPSLCPTYTCSTQVQNVFQDFGVGLLLGVELLKIVLGG